MFPFNNSHKKIFYFDPIMSSKIIAIVLLLQL